MTSSSRIFECICQANNKHQSKNLIRTLDYSVPSAKEKIRNAVLFFFTFIRSLKYQRRTTEEARDKTPLRINLKFCSRCIITRRYILFVGDCGIESFLFYSRCDFFVYQAIDAPPIKATDNQFDRKVLF